VTLGAWFTLAGPYYQDDLKPIERSSSEVDPLVDPQTWEKQPVNIKEALSRYPTILAFHGNAGTRALPLRVTIQRLYSSHLRANVLMIDYRGFADSTGSPSQEGLIEDALAAWDWLLASGARQEDISIVGWSLGTAVGAHLCIKLNKVSKYLTENGHGLVSHILIRSEAKGSRSCLPIHIRH
jgi:abhydrolase domain-containing protein 12